MEKKLFSTRILIYIAVMGALSVLIMFFEFPVLPIAPFLKVDFSDVITIIGGVTFGPAAGTLIALVRSLVNWILKGGDFIGLVGNLAGFIGSLAIMFPFVFSKRNNLFKIITSIISLTVIASLFNYFFLMPVYMNLAGMKLNVPLAKYILTIIVPFNIIKGTLVSVLSYIIYNRMKNYLKRIKKDI